MESVEAEERFVAAAGGVESTADELEDEKLEDDELKDWTGDDLREFFGDFEDELNGRSRLAGLEEDDEVVEEGMLGEALSWRACFGDFEVKS